MNPFFSIIIPTYNRAGFISRAIHSVLNQLYNQFELIIVDDGSTDHTQEVINNIQSSKLVYYKIKNLERGFARNYGVQQSSGTYVTFLDSDDMFFPNHLSTAFNHIEKLNNPEIFFLNNVTTDTSGKIIRNKKIIRGNLNDKIFNGNIFGSMGVFLRRDVARDYPFREERELSGTEDWELWLRLSARHRFHYSNNATCSFIEHPGRSVLKASEEQLKKRTELLVQSLLEDSAFNLKYKSRIHKIRAHMLSYTALHLALNNQKSRSFIFFLKALRCSAEELFTKRTLAIIKHLL